MRTRSATRWLLALLSVLALSAAACNDDGEETVDHTGTTQPLPPEEDEPADVVPDPDEVPEGTPGEVTDEGPATPVDGADGQGDGGAAGTTG